MIHISHDCPAKHTWEQHGQDPVWSTDGDIYGMRKDLDEQPPLLAWKTLTLGSPSYLPFLSTNWPVRVYVVHD